MTTSTIQTRRTKGSKKHFHQFQTAMPKIRQATKQYEVEKGHVEFRLLCKNSAIGGLIGTNASIINSLQLQTSSKIYVNVPGPTSIQHRVSHVIAPYHRTNTVTLGGVSSKVSPAQEALIRVFHRLVEAEEEAEGSNAGVVKCVLVVGSGMVGAVMGVNGGRITKVCRETRAYVKILPLHFHPPGTNLNDELVQITGGILPVKKALVIVSQFLQQKVFEREALEASSRFVDRSMKLDTRNARVNNTANGGEEAEVIFRLIYPCEAAAFVIGFKGKKVRSIEEETGAFILFSVADPGTRDCVVTISAFESRESQYSLAQNATVRVFNELVAFEEENAKEGNAVTARLLILPYQSDWLSGGEDSIMSTTHKTNGVIMKIMELTNLPFGAAADEKVLQIEGDYPNVQTALFQVTWILRERVFDASLPKDSLPLLPHKLLNMPPQGKISAVTDKMNNCRVSKETNGSRPSLLPHSQFSSESSLTTGTGSSGDSVTANTDFNFASPSFVVTNTTLEIAVREDVFNVVYGENGNNLARLRKISGATVEVRDPSAGNDGKVIISGTRDQTLVAQSLLQAFLMTA